MIKIYKTIAEYEEVLQSLPPNQKITLFKFDHNSRGSYHQTIYKTYLADNGYISDKECE